MNYLKNTLLFIRVQMICTKNYARQKVKKKKKNEDQAYLIKEMLNTMKEAIKNVSKNRNLRLKKTKKQ